MHRGNMYRSLTVDLQVEYVQLHHHIAIIISIMFPDVSVSPFQCRMFSDRCNNGVKGGMDISQSLMRSWTKPGLMGSVGRDNLSVIR